MEINGKQIYLGTIIYIHEETAGIKYHNSQFKGPRPFVVIHSKKNYKDFYNPLKNFIVVSPITRVQDKSKPNTFWKKTKYKNIDHYVMNDNLLILGFNRVLKLSKLMFSENLTALQIKWNTKISLSNSDKLISQIFEKKKS